MSLKTSIASLAIAAVAAAAISTNLAAAQRSHPVRSWNGNEYLFEITDRGGNRYMNVYRATSAFWRRVGSTRISEGQTQANGSIWQKIWFNGRVMRNVRADMSSSFDRYWPGDDHEGGDKNN